MKNKIIASVALVGLMVGCIAYIAVAANMSNIIIQKNAEDSETGNISIASEASEITDENYETDAAEPAYFTCTGYSDMDLQKNAAVYLKNNSENDQFGIYVKYDIYDDQNGLLYESDLIEPGKQIDFIPSDYLSSGSYVISIVQTPYIYNDETDTYDSKFPGVQEINLTIR